ncbi:hypothetical protein KAU32_12350 [bacterium]|nr:hypothetical protein [bacterium]
MRFYRIARGSVSEIDAQVEISHRVKLLKTISTD